MIDASIIDSLDSGARLEFRLAALQIVNSGVFQAQVELEKRRIFANFHDEEPEALAKRIVDARQRCAMMEGLIQILLQEGSKIK